ncbi:MAG: UDP-N-acetylmuramoyl-L-alanine--D-glutamate ligase [bacterium]|nr:UDP-N-acetylmuramoyl-L-alanine--D-glutamate ligase [bacterium]MDE0601215.1 UDP-N-acetylmuramoyl-L-alanine--D-glutamate ligase [bacterium]
MKRCLVLGAGVSGRAAARLGGRLGWRMRVYDARPEAIPPLNGSERWTAVTGRWRPEWVSDCDLVVASPGFPEESEPIRDSLAAGRPVWSEVELACRHLRTEMIAITGTNGKTTVARLTGEMLARSGMEVPVVGNIGSPISDLVGRGVDRAVVELSSFQLRFTETISPRVAVIINVAPDHLDWHGTMDRYLAAKARIHAAQTEDDVLIFDADDPGARRAVKGARSGLAGVSVSGSVDRGDLVTGGLRIPVAELSVRDPSYLTDLLIAAAAARTWGADDAAVEAAIRDFRPGPHRRRVVGELDGVRFVDDSKATNPHAALASIHSFGSVVLVAGGLNKGLDLSPLTTASPVRAVVSIGQASPELVEAGPPGRVTPVDSLEEAVRTAFGISLPGDVVLLAPGCASFDQFDSYQARGEQFARLVSDLVGSRERT